MMANTARPNFDAIKGRQQATWAAGNYAVVGSTLVLISERLCEAVDLHAGERVLDVATGNGNTALAAARRWCDATGIDYVPALLEQARARAAADGLTVTFREGDAERIPYPDASFDAVLSTLGSMFAPDQERAARELIRVCRPGGRIGMANWTPDGFIGQLFKLTARYVPPAPGLTSPVLWGSEARVRELFGDAVTDLRLTVQQFVFRFRSAQHFVEVFGGYYGPTLKAFEALDASGRDRYAADLAGLAERFNRAADGTVAVPSDYLEIVATRVWGPRGGRSLPHSSQNS